MPVKKYSDFLEISPTFESVVDIDADTRNRNLWREYIVGEDMEKLMEVLCQSLGNEGPDLRKSFWMHGSYGTGKSYAAIFVKHLLEDPKDVVEDYLSKSSRLSKFKNRFMKCRSHGDYLVVWKTGCTGVRSGNMMLMEAEQAVRHALVEKFGENADLGSRSMRDAVREKLNDASINWDHVIDSTLLSEDYEDVDYLRAAVDADDLDAIQRTAQVLQQMGFGLINNLDTFKEWMGEVIDANGLAQSGIFFIWDEFTEYISNSDDHTIMQQLSEFSKVKPFFMLYVVHRSAEMVGSLGEDNYQRIIDRFHQVEFHITASAALDLIAGSITTRTGMQNHWEDERKAVVRRIRPFLPDMSGLDDKMTNMIGQLCPIHPMTIRLLSRVAESFAAAQRTMFRFMKDQSSTDLGFVGYINQHGPDDEACWMTPEWLWDYFFTRDSDFNDKDTKVAPYIQHYMDSLRLVESDEDALRVFKIVMLLLAVSSTTKGIYGTSRMQGGIIANQECLENCVAGVISKQKVDSLLSTLEQDKLVLRDVTPKGEVRLQLPFRGGSADAYQARLEANDKKFTRYQMFAKDGPFSSKFEKQAWDENDATFKRMKVAVCAAETQSIKARLDEVEKELDKAPYKLGLLVVTVKDDPQYLAVIADLQQKAAETDPRLTIALLKAPLTDEVRKNWLASVTKQELAEEGGQTASANQYRMDAEKTVHNWVSQAAAGGSLKVWIGGNVYNNQYGMPQLRNTIKQQVLNVRFPYAPEHIVKTVTAYKPCNDSAAAAGIARKSTNSQMSSVLNTISPAVLQMKDIEAMANATADPGISALAKMVRDKMSSGQKVILSDLWDELQKEPFGYYDNIACGILLGLVLSCYKNSIYSWTDSVQSSHDLNEANLKTMVLNLCKGKMSTDYLSAGSLTFQKFRDYVKEIFALKDDLVATETTCYQSMREAIVHRGTPFWALKYLPEGSFLAKDQEAACQIIDGIQQFIANKGEREPIMYDVLHSFNGRGKVKVVLRNAFANKDEMAGAFRTFLYQSSPELKEIADQLSISPIDLNDRLQKSMQSAIYTWTEEQVQAKLADIVDEYRYLTEVNGAMGKKYHNLESARTDLKNIFLYQKIPYAAVEAQPWSGALKSLWTLSRPYDYAQLSKTGRNADAALLREHGKAAYDFLKDSKPTLMDILSNRGEEVTSGELDTIHSGLRKTPFDATLESFDASLKEQLGRISSARNRAKLLAKWEQLTGKETVKAWCDANSAPIFWVVSSELQKPIHTVIDVKQNHSTTDQNVVAALNALSGEAALILTDSAKSNAVMRQTLGLDERSMDYFNKHSSDLFRNLKYKRGDDMSTWQISELNCLRDMIRDAMKEEYKKEKLVNAKQQAASMPDTRLRDLVAHFLDLHPEYCDDFLK